MKRYLTLSLLAVSAFAQAPQPPIPTRSTQMAMQALAEELTQIQKDFAAVDAQVSKDLPGYHLAQNLKIEKDAPKPEVKTEPKK